MFQLLGCFFMVRFTVSTSLVAPGINLFKIFCWKLMLNCMACSHFWPHFSVTLEKGLRNCKPKNTTPKKCTDKMLQVTWSQLNSSIRTALLHSCVCGLHLFVISFVCRNHRNAQICIMMQVLSKSTGFRISQQRIKSAMQNSGDFAKVSFTAIDLLNREPKIKTQ